VLEVLETRRLRTNFDVFTTDDSGSGSLRQAILDANQSPGADLIDFQFEIQGVATISLLSPLPPITNAVRIDGTTQVGFAGTPLVELDGSAAGTGAGLTVLANGTEIVSLAINRFSGAGIFISGLNQGGVIQGCFLGTDPSGTKALPNMTGLTAESSSNLTLEDNVISGNTGNGILMTAVDAVSSNNKLDKNRIGTDVTGTAALGNGGNGVEFDNVSQSLIGGSSNVISANGGDGVLLQGTGSTANKVTANFIGTDINGTAALGNGGAGIRLSDAAGNTIGGILGSDDNVISANRLQGIEISGTAATTNQVTGNLIGTDRTGRVALGNIMAGVQIESGASNNTIGGTGSDDRNLISGNGQRGINILDAGSTGNLVQGNFIGVTGDGTAALPNASDGIAIVDGVSNSIGGTTDGAGNVISGNGGNGILLDLSLGSADPGNLVAGNLIGTDASGTAALGNAQDGVLIRSSFNTVGGTESGARNVISGNARSGVHIATLVLSSAGASSDNTVLGNLIGTDITGRAALANHQSGILIEDAPNNTIGGLFSGAGNVISGNGSSGVRVLGTGATGNAIHGNLIGTDDTGSSALGNAGNGIFIQDASQTLIGGSTPLAGNTIAFNGGPQAAAAGVAIVSGTGNAILGDSIFSNTGLGIDLGPSGVTPNDPEDPDLGANKLQNFPVITSAQISGTTIAIAGELNSIPGLTFTLEFFSSPAADTSGFGEGQQFSGSTTVSTDSQGNATINLFLPVLFAPGQFITATATDPDGNTSEFSQAILSTPSVSPSLTGLAICAIAPVPFTDTPVATFQVNGPQRPADSFNATINWGDNSLPSSGSITLSGNIYTIRGSHTYFREGTFAVTITLASADSQPVSAVTTATVGGFVTSLFREVLQRLPDAGGLSFWQDALQNGASRSQVSEGFWVSAEHRGLEVDQFYATFLKRAADARGRAFWVQSLLEGATEDEVAVAFLTSEEYTASHPDVASYVSGLYQDVLGRVGDTTGAAGWEQILASGARTRAAVAYYFLTSAEAYVQAIDNYYLQFLGRAPDPTGFVGYFNALFLGLLDPAGITSIFLGSPEYLARELARPCTPAS
jgi:parallel beta-helix repeat protein